MRLVRRCFAPLLVVVLSCSVYRPSPEGREGALPETQGDPAGTLGSLAEAALAALYAAYPERATLDGVHEHDGRLGDWSREGVEGWTRSVQHFLRRLEGIPLDLLPDAAYYDALMLGARLRAELLELETVRGWRRNPGHYRELISEGLYGLAALRFHTPEQRRALAASRLRDIPGLLAAARSNLEDPPRLYTELALDDFAGLAVFVKDELPKAFGEGKDAAFTEAHKAALASLDGFIDWLRKDLLPRSTGGYALGAAVWSAKLLHEEGVETPPDVLLKRGYELLRRTQEELRRAGAAESKDLPEPSKLLDEARGTLAELRRWASTVVDLPDAPEVLVQETPSFRRSTSFASMQLPGPFETSAKEAYYSITLPDASWTDERKAQHLSFFSRPSLALISVHEAWPGHYAQFLLARQAPTPVRKALGSAAFSEGWAHYCEQLYAESVPAVRPAQLRMALLRICRYVVAIEMHTRGMTVEKAVDFFVAEGLQPRAAAEREARRGAVDPLYLVYTLGKNEILALRDDWRNATGGSMKDFHNALLRLGAPPLKLARMMLLRGRPRG